ncbi:MAG TPA: DUF2784 domain-containing protein [Albitalea sp.]|uniref:DUF2784 domain-containing protein n=1 Tax=Piscinibacter sp. TaxID=1903157 RepID=UPI002ECFEA5F
MLWRWLADAVLVVHLGFVLFALLGALAVWRWPSVAWLHLPALVWGAYVVLAGDICPLTPLEVHLRVAGGEAGYDISFIERYLLPLIYPDVVQGDAGRGLQQTLGMVLLGFNAAIYALWIRRRR